MSTLQILAKHRALLAEVACGTVAYDMPSGVYLIDGEPAGPLEPDLRDLTMARLIRRDLTVNGPVVPVIPTDAGEREAL